MVDQLFVSSHVCFRRRRLIAINTSPEGTGGGGRPASLSGAAALNRP